MKEWNDGQGRQQKRTQERIEGKNKNRLLNSRIKKYRKR